MPHGHLKGSALTGAANSVGTSIAATGSVSVSIGDLIYCVECEQTASTATSVTDSLTNTYTATQVAFDAGTIGVRAFYTISAFAGTLTSVTATTNGGTANAAISACVFGGPFTTSPLDSNPTIAEDVTSPFATPATGTLAQGVELVVCFIGSSGNATITATAPNNGTTQISSQAILTLMIGWQTRNSTASFSPEFTGTNPTDSGLGVNSFKLDPVTGFEMVGFTNPHQQIATGAGGSPS